MKTLFTKYRGLFIAFLFVGLLAVMVPLALGVNQADQGWQINPNQVRTITAIGTSSQLTVVNSSTISYFVPSKTASELKAFIDHRPSKVETGYCGDTICNGNIGETACNNNYTSVGTCPIDCGPCVTVPNLVTTSSPWSVYMTGMGAYCGDGRCDSGLGEKPGNCAYDCGTSKGCCAVKKASPANSNIFTNCSLYSVTATTTNFGSTPCSFQPACLSSYSSYPAYYGICGKNPDYPCNTYSIADNTCVNHPTCMASGTSCVKKKDCADYTDSSSCGGNSDCIWVGQSDSPYCYGYCDKPVSPDINTRDNPYYTYQTCQTHTQNRLSGYYSQYGGVDSYICGVGKRDVTNVPTNPNYCKANNCFEENRGGCSTASSYQETVRNCPLNCGSIDSTTGKANATADGCGDGVCATTERKGGSNYCYVDCGDIGDGNCLAFSGICPKFNYNKAGCDATYVCSYSSSNNLCAINAAFGPSLPNDATCAKGKNRNECNRIGCYWQDNKVRTCGNGVIDSGETDITCPADFYAVNIHGYYCQGLADCVKKTTSKSCTDMTGCQWVAAGAYTAQ